MIWVDALGAMSFDSMTNTPEIITPAHNYPARQLLQTTNTSNLFGFEFSFRLTHSGFRGGL